MANSDTKGSPGTRTGLFAFNSRVVGKQELIIDPAQEWRCEAQNPCPTALSHGTTCVQSGRGRRDVRRRYSASVAFGKNLLTAVLKPGPRTI